MKFSTLTFGLMELAFYCLSIYVAFQDKKTDAILMLIAGNTFHILRKINK